jgi:hypothetical protein
MTPETQLIIKIVAGTTLIIALVIGFCERWFKPDVLVTEESKEIPSWVGWLGWGLASAATVAYVLVDYVQWQAEA